MIKRLVQTIALSLAAFLVGCGGDDSSYATVDVTPVAGKFSSGTVDVFNSTGAKIGSASVNSTTGKATVTLNVTSAPSIMVFRVAGGSYYDEGTNASATNDYMLSVVSAGATGGSYAVTPLTHMAAAIAGVSMTSSAASFTPPATFTTTSIAAAINAVPLLLGVDPAQLDITAPPTLISAASTAWPSAVGSATTAKANAYAYLLAVISANARAAGLTNGQMVEQLRSASATYYNNGAATGTFTMPSGMLGVDGKLNTANLATYNSTMVTALSSVSANAIGTNTFVPFTSKTAIASAVAAGYTAAALAVQPGAYCPTYEGRQILDPTDPKNAPYFATATGYMTNGGFRVSQVVSGQTPNDFTIFGAGGADPNAGIYLEYYTVYGLPSWASGAGSGAIFTGTYSGVSGGTDGFALNTLMMSDGYTGTGTFMLTYSGMTTPTPYFLSTTGGSTGALRPVVLTCPNL